MNRPIKILDKEEANVVLKSIDMELGDWNEIKNISSTKIIDEEVIIYEAPRNVDELYCFSHHIIQWLLPADWMIFQVDNSTSLMSYEGVLLSNLLCDLKEPIDFVSDRTFLFSFNKETNKTAKNALTLSSVIYFFILFQCHGYLVSSASMDGDTVAFQDGFLYFSFRKIKAKKLIVELLDEFEKDKLKLPNWILNT